MSVKKHTFADLVRIVQSMANASKAAGVPVVTGDTKVVERGKGDGVFITTTGVGVVAPGRELSGQIGRASCRGAMQSRAMQSWFLARWVTMAWRSWRFAKVSVLSPPSFPIRQHCMV